MWRQQTDVLGKLTSTHADCRRSVNETAETTETAEKACWLK